MGWKEEHIEQSDKLFGPLQPPPPGANCRGSNSVNSETSSTGSIQTQSGEWDVLDKPGEVVTPVAVEVKQNLGGWNVHPTSSSATSVASGDENNGPSTADDKMKKKKKKKRRKRREEIGEVEVKFVPITKQRSETLQENGDRVENNRDEKPGLNENMHLESTVSLPLPDALHSDSNSSETHHYKKKKKKHKRRYSLVIDTNNEDIGEISILIELNKSTGKPQIVTGEYNGHSSSHRESGTKSSL